MKLFIPPSLEAILKNTEKTQKNKNWISGAALCDERSLMGYELFEFLQKGLPAYTSTGLMIIDIDKLEKKRRYTIEDIKRQISLAQGPSDYTVLTGQGHYEPPSRGMSAQEIDAWAKRIYVSTHDDDFGWLLETYVEVPDGCRAVSFTLPNEEKERLKRIQEAKAWLFKIEDVNDYEKKNGYAPIGEVEEAEQEVVEAPEKNKEHKSLVQNLIPDLDKTGNNDEALTIPIKPGTIWEQISIRIVNEQRIEITTPTGMAPWSAEQLGLRGKRELWKLLEKFALREGSITSKGERRDKANVSNLRKLLQALFPHVEGKPIKDYDKRNGYECRFNISASTYYIEEAEGTDSHYDDLRETYLRDIGQE